MICFQVEIKQWEFSLKIFDALQITFKTNKQQKDQFKNGLEKQIVILVKLDTLQLFYFQ